MNPRDLRKKLGLRQDEFWGNIGVTQSGGSRYESGRKMPEPTEILLKLYYQSPSLSRYRFSKNGIELIYLHTEVDGILKKLKRRRS